MKISDDGILRLAFLAPFVFFTLSSTKFPHYILPAIPFLVLLIARAVEAEVENPKRNTSRLLWVLAAVVVGLIAKDLLEGRNYRSLSLPVCERACDHESVWLFQSQLLGDESDMEDVAAAIKKIQANLAELKPA